MDYARSSQASFTTNALFLAPSAPWFSDELVKQLSEESFKDLGRPLCRRSLGASNKGAEKMATVLTVCVIMLTVGLLVWAVYDFSRQLWNS